MPDDNTTKAKEVKKKAFQISFWLTVILLVQLVGFFTLTENIAITRVLKVILRIGSVGWIILYYRKLVKKGNVASLKYEHTLVPLLYGAYLFMGLVSFLWSTNIGYSALQLIMDIESFVFAYYYIKIIVLVNNYYPEYKFRLSATVFYSILLIQLWFLIGMFTVPDTYYRLTHGGDVARLGGFLMNPNELGMLAVVGLACGIVELLAKDKKVLTLLGMLTILYALIQTGSRSSMIGFMLIVGYFINKSNNQKLKMAVYVGMILAVPVIVQTIFIKQGDLEEVLSMTGRLPFWKALLTEGLPESPWYGFGFMRISWTGSFKSVHTYEGHMTHNTFIQVLMNLGFIGFFIVLMQMVVTLRAFAKSKDDGKKKYFVGIFIPILINSFTEFGIFGETNYGILFYQLLIWLFVIDFNPKLNLLQKVTLQKMRPAFYEKLTHKNK